MIPTMRSKAKHPNGIFFKKTGIFRKGWVWKIWRSGRKIGSTTEQYKNRLDSVSNLASVGMMIAEHFGWEIIKHPKNQGQE